MKVSYLPSSSRVEEEHQHKERKKNRCVATVSSSSVNWQVSITADDKGILLTQKLKEEHQHEERERSYVATVQVKVLLSDK